MMMVTMTTEMALKTNCWSSAYAVVPFDFSRRESRVFLLFVAANSYACHSAPYIFRTGLHDPCWWLCWDSGQTALTKSLLS